MLSAVSTTNFCKNLQRDKIAYSAVTFLVIALIALSAVNLKYPTVNVIGSYVSFGAAGVISLLGIALACVAKDKKVEMKAPFYKMTKDKAELVKKVLVEGYSFPYICQNHGEEWEYFTTVVRGALQENVQLVKNYKAKPDAFTILSQDTINRVFNLPEESGIPPELDQATIKLCASVLREGESFKYKIKGSSPILFCYIKDGNPAFTVKEIGSHCRLEFLQIRIGLKMVVESAASHNQA